MRRASPDGNKTMMSRLLALIVSTPIVSLLLQQAPAPPQAPDYSQEAAIVEQSPGRRIDSRRTARARASSSCASRFRATPGSRRGDSSCSGSTRRTRRWTSSSFASQGGRHRRHGSTRRGAGSDVAGRARGARLHRLPSEARDGVASLRPGDTLEFSFTTVIHTALAPGQFWTEYDFTRQGAVLDEQLEIDVPLDVAVKLKTQPGFDAQTSEANGRRVYRWHGSHMPGNEERSGRTGPLPRVTAATCRPCGSRPSRRGRTSGAGTRGSSGASGCRTTNCAARRRSSRRGSRRRWRKWRRSTTTWRRTSATSASRSAPGAISPAPPATSCAPSTATARTSTPCSRACSRRSACRPRPRSSNSERKIDPDFPSPSQFDHVITRLAGNGIDLWLDTTTEIAPFRLLTRQSPQETGAGRRRRRRLSSRGDARRPAGAVDPGEPKSTGSSTATGTLKAHVRLELRGDVELFIRAVTRRTPRAQWKQLIESLNEQSRRDRRGQRLDDLRSRPTRARRW